MIYLILSSSVLYVKYQISHRRAIKEIITKSYIIYQQNIFKIVLPYTFWQYFKENGKNWSGLLPQNVHPPLHIWSAHHLFFSDLNLLSQLFQLSSVVLQLHMSTKLNLSSYFKAEHWCLVFFIFYILARVCILRHVLYTILYIFSVLKTTSPFSLLFGTQIGSKDKCYSRLDILLSYRTNENFFPYVLHT